MNNDSGGNIKDTWFGKKTRNKTIMNRKVLRVTWLHGQ